MTEVQVTALDDQSVNVTSLKRLTSPPPPPRQQHNNNSCEPSDLTVRRRIIKPAQTNTLHNKGNNKKPNNSNST
jgi:hypothetical protein